MKRTIGIFLLLASLVFLVLGLIYPFMTFNFNFEMEGLLGGLFGSGLSKELTKTYSVPEVMQLLFKHKYYFVGTLIGLFAVVIPIVKAILTFVFLFNKKMGLYRFIGIIGKFAMADVFCVGIFIAFLYTQFNQGLKMEIKANIEVGYYYFVAYVILNIISVILIKPTNQQV
jgi:paraquat-inducible protein A